jgi:hypothetical protein
MPATSRLRPGYVVSYPNRDKRSSRTTRAAVLATLLASVGLIATVTVGGWSELAGLEALNFAWCVAYLVIAVYIYRWARGPLPIAAALASLMLVISLLAGTGATGTSWFDHSHPGYAPAYSLFGGPGLGANLLGVLTLLIAPVQLLLIVLAAQGFRQAWNVELEVPVDERGVSDEGRAGDAPVPSSA